MRDDQPNTTEDGVQKCVLQAVAWGLAGGTFTGLFFGTVIVLVGAAFKIVELMR